MQNKIIILIVFIVFAGIAYDSRARGIKNNNPGNLKLSSDKWQGLRSVQSDPVFFQFVDDKYGVRALMITLINYKKLYGIKTIGEIVQRYAPSTENDTLAYIKFVSSKSGFRQYEVIDLQNKETLFKIVNAIIIFETGSHDYTTKDFASAYSLI